MEKTVQKFVVIHDSRVYNALSSHAKVLRKQFIVNLIFAGVLVYTLRKLNKNEKGDKTEGEK